MWVRLKQEVPDGSIINGGVGSAVTEEGCVFTLRFFEMGPGWDMVDDEVNF